MNSKKIGEPKNRKHAIKFAKKGRLGKRQRKQELQHSICIKDVAQGRSRCKKRDDFQHFFITPSYVLLCVQFHK